MVIDDLSAPRSDIEQELDVLLRQLVGPQLALTPGRSWRWTTEAGELFCFLEELPRDEEPGTAAERILELVRPVADLGFTDQVPPEQARALLRSTSNTRQARIARGAHPGRSRHQALLATITLHLEDLDADELDLAIRQLTELKV